MAPLASPPPPDSQVGTTSAFPASALLKSHLSLPRTELLDSLLPLLPPPEEKKKEKKRKETKRKHQLPGRGSRQKWGKRTGRRRARARRGEAHTALGGRAGQYRGGRGPGSGCSCPLPPRPLSRDFNTTKGTGVCRVISDREERGAGETSRENLADAPKTCLPPFLPVGK